MVVVICLLSWCVNRNVVGFGWNGVKVLLVLNVLIVLGVL